MRQRRQAATHFGNAGVIEFADDDALALVIHKLTGWRLSRAYLFTDLTVLFASLSYIPFRRIAFSLVTVTVSSLLIDFIKEWQPKTNV